MAVFHPRTRFDSFLEGGLDPVTHRRVSEHLDRCPMCQDEVEQRQRIMRAAASDDTEPLRLQRRPLAEGAVLEERAGVPGWKVVLTLGAAGVAAGAVVMAAWVAGEPALTATAPEPPALIPMAEAEPSASSSVADTQPVAEDSRSAGPFSALAATSVERSVAPAARTDTQNLLDALRRQGWNIPSLSAAGLDPESVGLREHQDSAELVLALDGATASAVLQECRPLDVPLAKSDCLEDRALDAPEGATTEMRLPLGLTSRVQEHEDGSWTARVDTAQAAYTLRSDLPVERADRVMSLVVLSERARVQSAQLPDSASERLVRGFERLMPWSEDTASAR